MKSRVLKRSIVIAGHKTSVSLEDEFWRAFKEIADQRDLSVSELAAVVDAERAHDNLSSAIRLFVLRFHRDRLADFETRERTRAALARATAPNSTQGH